MNKSDRKQHVEEFRSICQVGLKKYQLYIPKTETPKFRQQGRYRDRIERL